MKARRNTILSSKDTEVLIFLWKYRLATFQTLRQKFFASENWQRAYDRLRKIERGEFIKHEKIPGTADTIWRLAKRGFDFLIGTQLPELKAKRSQPHSYYHDLIASAALVGDWLMSTPDKVRIISEQEIKAIEIPDLVSEYPKGLEHHPDGIWLFTSGNRKRFVALEVELSAKSSKKYEEICAFYSSNVIFENVIWIVKSEAHGNQILNASRENGIPREGIHLFVMLDQFRSLLWQSPIRNQAYVEPSMAMVLKALLLGQDLHQFKKGVYRGSNRGLMEIKSVLKNPLLDFRLNQVDSRTSFVRTAVEN